MAVATGENSDTPPLPGVSGGAVWELRDKGWNLDA